MPAPPYIKLNSLAINFRTEGYNYVYYIIAGAKLVSFVGRLVLGLLRFGSQGEGTPIEQETARKEHRGVNDFIVDAIMACLGLSHPEAKEEIHFNLLGK